MALTHVDVKGMGPGRAGSVTALAYHFEDRLNMAKTFAESPRPSSEISPLESRRLPSASNSILLVVLGSIFVMGAWLRFRGLGVSCLWLDEIITAQTAVRGPRFILQHNASLFMSFFFEWLSQQFGTSEFWVRLPCAVFGSLSVGLIAYVAFSLSRDRLAAVLASLFLAFSDRHLYYSREARAYSLLVLLSLLSFYLMHHSIVQNKARWWIAWGLASLVGLYTSYFYSFVEACLVIYALGWLGHYYMERKTWQQDLTIRLTWLVAICCILGLLFLPSVLWAARTYQDFAQSRGYSYDTRVIPWLVSATQTWLPFSYSVFIIPIVLIILGDTVATKKPRGLNLLFLTLLILLPALFFRVLRPKHFLAPRYLIAPLPFFLMFSSIGLAGVVHFFWERAGRLPIRAAGWAARCGLALVVVLLVGFYSSRNLKSYRRWALEQKQDWRSTVAFLKKNVQENDLIVPGVDFTYICLGHYLPLELRRSLTEAGSGDAQNLPPLARSGKRIWYVAPDYALNDVPAIKKWLDQHFTLVQTIQGSIRIYKGPKSLYP